MRTMKVKFEADIDDGIIQELKFWNLTLEDVIKDSIEHSITSSIRRKTDNLCRNCKKPIESSIPAKNRANIREYCKCN